MWLIMVNWCEIRRSSDDQLPLGASCLDNAAISGENLNVRYRGKVTIISNDLHYAMASHGFKKEQI